MTTRPLIQGKRTFYLDTSTLCDAFRAVYEHAGRPEFAGLCSWIEDVARNANLVLSVVHVLELRHWESRDTARAIMEWLDGLPIVWMRSVDQVVSDEDDYWFHWSLGAHTLRLVPALPLVQPGRVRRPRGGTR